MRPRIIIQIVLMMIITMVTTIIIVIVQMMLMIMIIITDGPRSLPQLLRAETPVLESGVLVLWVCPRRMPNSLFLI